MVVTWIVTAGLIIFARVATRDMKHVPDGAQNLLEWLVGSLYGFLEGVIGPHLVKRTFWFFASIFIFILSANWIGLIPGVGTIGWGHQTAEGFKIEDPLFRGANADLNLTLAMALAFFACWIVWALREVGLRGFLKELFAPKGETAGADENADGSGVLRRRLPGDCFDPVPAGLSELSSLAVGYQPTLAAEMGDLQERITSTKKGSITSFQAVYVPADDLTDPAPATTFAHLDATIVLERSIAELGIYPRRGSAGSSSRALTPEIVGQEHYDVARGVQKVLQTLQGFAGHHRDSRHGRTFAR